MKDTIIVTGGAGFIGRYVESRIHELGLTPMAFDRSDSDVFDVTNEAVIHELWNPDTTRAVIHLAGQLGTHELWDQTDQAIDVNIKGGLNVARWCAEHDVKLVSIEQPHIWYNVYEATKLAVKRMMIGLTYSEGLRVDFVTAHNAYGPGQAHGEGHPRKIIPYFATQAWAGEPLEIWGDGEQRVNLVYAGDVADLLVERAIANNTAVYAEWQAGVRQLWDVNAVANFVIATTGGWSEIIHNMDGRRGEQSGPGFQYPTPDDRYKYQLSFTKLAQTIEWYRP